MPRRRRASGALAASVQRWPRALLLCLLPRAACNGPGLAQQPGDVAHDDPKKFFGWSQYRYTRFEESAPPRPHDKETAILTGGDVKCEVCKVILVDVIERLATKRGVSGEDAILEALEADSIDQEAVLAAKSQMDAYVLKHYGGCNRLFKESYLAKGFGIESCTRLAEGQHHMTLPEEQALWACSKRQKAIPSERELNTYSVQKEAAHYACERTVGDHRDALAAFLAARLGRGGANVTELAGEAFGPRCRCSRHRISRGKSYWPYIGMPQDLVDAELGHGRHGPCWTSPACRKKAKCLVRRPGESPENRVKAQEEKAKQISDRVDELIKKEEKRAKRRKRDFDKAARHSEEAARRGDEVEL